MVILAGFERGLLPSYLIIPFHTEVQRVEKAFLTNLEGYELLVNNHRALNPFFRCILLISEYSFQSGAQCLAQIYNLIIQKY